MDVTYLIPHGFDLEFKPRFDSLSETEIPVVVVDHAGEVPYYESERDHVRIRVEIEYLTPPGDDWITSAYLY